MDLIRSGRYIDIFLCQNMYNNKKKYSGGVSCSACNAFIMIYIYFEFPTFCRDVSKEDKTVPAVCSADIPCDVPSESAGSLHARYHSPAYGPGASLW